jgi:heme A synthase
MPTFDEEKWMTIVRWLAGITMALVLIQALLIGQGLYLGDPGKTALHGWLGSASLIGALILAGFLFVGARRDELPRPALSLAVVIPLLMIVQLGLGYMGRRGGWPAALHIPNGVLIAALLAALVMLTLLPATREERARP